MSEIFDLTWQCLLGKHGFSKLLLLKIYEMCEMFKMIILQIVTHYDKIFQNTVLVLKSDTCLKYITNIIILNIITDIVSETCDIMSQKYQPRLILIISVTEYDFKKCASSDGENNF